MGKDSLLGMVMQKTCDGWYSGMVVPTYSIISKLILCTYITYVHTYNYTRSEKSELYFMVTCVATA